MCRWNSTLVMIDSILDNMDEVNGALLRTGNRELTISPIESGMLSDLRRFLKPFADFTKLVSGNVPAMGVVVLIKAEIRRLCALQPRESCMIKSLKTAVLNNLDDRLPVSDICQLATLLDPSTKAASDLSRPEQVDRQFTFAYL
jgi:hypothetical protein